MHPRPLLDAWVLPNHPSKDQQQQQRGPAKDPPEDDEFVDMVAGRNELVRGLPVLSSTRGN